MIPCSNVKIKCSVNYTKQSVEYLWYNMVFCLNTLEE